MEEFEGRRRGMLTTGRMVQPSQQYVAPCVKWVEWGLGTRVLRMVAAFWPGIRVKVTQEAGVVPRIRRAAIGTLFFSRLIRHIGKRKAYITLRLQGYRSLHQSTVILYKTNFCVSVIFLNNKTIVIELLILRKM